MKNIQSPFEPLIPLLLQDFWSRDEACMIFTGYVWKGEGAGARLTDIETCKVIPEFRDGGYSRSAEHEVINDRYIEIQQVWDGADHSWDSGIYRQNGHWNKYYILDWASTKAPVIEIPWLDWAYEKGFLNKKDHQRMLDIKGKKVVAVDTGKEAGEDELTNRNRLIAIFKNMLLDPEVGRVGVFKNQEAIADHIENNFNEKYPNKKLTANGVKEILAAGNKALKDTE